MYREINSADEILRRLLYIVYLGAVAAMFVLGVMGLVQQRLDCLAGMAAFALLGVVLKVYGRKRLEFERLARSFPYGAVEEDPDEGLRRQVAELLADFGRAKGDWRHRQQLRLQLLTLLEEDPRLWQAFRREIDEAFPALAAWAGHTSSPKSGRPSRH